MKKLKQANIIKTIEFKKGDKIIFVPLDAEVFVNVKESFAIFENVHFDIFRDEYRISS